MRSLQKSQMPDGQQVVWVQGKYDRAHEQIRRNIDTILEIATIQLEISKAVEFQPIVGYFAEGNGLLSWKGYDYTFNHPDHALDFMKEILKTGEITSWFERKKRQFTARETPMK